MQIGEGVWVAPPVEEPEEIKEEEKEHVKIRCSVFFDGTLNNRTNTNSRIAYQQGDQDGEGASYKEHQVKSKDNSYENDETNIAKMEKYVGESEGFDHSIPVYIEGPGTEDNKGDSTAGYALGQGDTGVKSKVRLGISNTLNNIVEKLKYGVIIDELVIDVFGFSRGAAGARYFVHEILNEAPTYISTPGMGYGPSSVTTLPAHPLFKRLKARGFEINKAALKVEFVGLYDTVASEGLAHWNDTSSLKLDSIARSQVKKVIHLVAADEHRANFSLTNIESAGGKGKEIFLPGVHSDIGGSYLKQSNEGVSRNEALLLNYSLSKSNLEKDRKQLIKEGWYQENEIWIDSPNIALKVLNPIGEKHKLYAHRRDIGHHYDKIPLHIMADFSRKSGIKLQAILETDHAIPSDLESIYNHLKGYANSSGSKLEDWVHKNTPSWLPGLRNKYFHYSAHYTREYGIYPKKPNFDNGQRTRVIREG